MIFLHDRQRQKFLHSSVLFNDLHSITSIPLEKSNQYFTGNIAVKEKELGTQTDVYQGNILHNLLHNFLLYAERSGIVRVLMN